MQEGKDTHQSASAAKSAFIGAVTGAFVAAGRGDRRFGREVKAEMTRLLTSMIGGAAVGFLMPFAWLGGHMTASIIGLCVGALFGAAGMIRQR